MPDNILQNDVLQKSMRLKSAELWRHLLLRSRKNILQSRARESLNFGHNVQQRYRILCIQHPSLPLTLEDKLDMPITINFGKCNKSGDHDLPHNESDLKSTKAPLYELSDFDYFYYSIPEDELYQMREIQVFVCNSTNDVCEFCGKEVDIFWSSWVTVFCPSGGIKGDMLKVNYLEVHLHLE